MAVVPFLGVGLASSVKNVSAQERTNCYLEFRPEDDKTRIVCLGTPGNSLFVNTGASPIRGGHVFGDYLYIAIGTGLYRVSGAGVQSSLLGTITATQRRVTMTDNGTQLFIGDGAYGFVYTPSSGAFAQITDTDFPGATSSGFLDGRIMVNDPDTNDWYGSDAYDATSWGALNFATAEGSPDAIVRVHCDGSNVILYGEQTIEFWQNVGGSGFPYARVGGANVEFGLAASLSLAPWDNGEIGLMKNRLGQAILGVRNGYGISRVSDDDWEREITGYGVRSDATAFSYRLNGHPFYQINFPTADRSWLFDGATGQFSRLKSAGLDRSRLEQAWAFNDKIIAADYTNGKLYQLDPDLYAENGETIAFELVSRHQITRKDYEHVSINELQVDIDRGVGIATGQGSDPQIMLQVSKDGGKTWGNERWVSMGAIGETRTRAVWRRLGTAYNGDWTFKLRVTDPVKRAILGASIR